MLLRDLQIENFRSFDEYRIKDLARVNLLVGDNNCGKTSVLEAAYLLAEEGSFHSLNFILQLREDYAFGAPEPGQAVGRQLFFARSIFRCAATPRDVIEPLPHIRIRASALRRGKSANIELMYEVPKSQVQLSTPSQLLPAAQESALKSTYQCDKEPIHGETSIDRLGRIGTLSMVGARFGHDPDPSLFIPTEGLTTRQIAAIWARLLPTKKETYVTEAMQIIDPRLTQVIPSPDTERRRDILVDLGSGRVPLSQLGGGALAMLSLGCGLAYVADQGILFVDEIDTGLHYSRLADMWRMVIKTAAKLDAQVFATTHSLDCIRALAATVEREPEVADDVAVFRIDRTSQEAVRFAGKELPVVAEHEIEVR